MAEPWKYIHTVQTGFDYGKLRFSEEFYDDVAPEAQAEPWAVTFEGGFRGVHGTPGKERSIGKTFFWAGDEWLVPAAYICKEGIVLDIVKRVPAEKLFSFREKWSLSRENDGSDWEEAQRIRAQAENPFHEDIGARLTVNGRTLSQSHGCGLCWDALYPDGKDREAKRVQAHYALDELSGWHVQRLCFPWDGKKERTIRELTFTLWENPFEALGQEFSPEQAGDSIMFHLPGGQRTYTLTALALHTEKIPYFEETLYTTELSYDIAPEVPDGSVTLRDFGEAIAISHGDFSGCAFGVIGGADGPTKILLSSGDGVNIWLIVVLIAVFAIGAFIGYRNRNKY